MGNVCVCVWFTRTLYKIARASCTNALGDDLPQLGTVFRVLLRGLGWAYARTTNANVAA